MGKRGTKRRCLSPKTDPLSLDYRSDLSIALAPSHKTSPTFDNYPNESSFSDVSTSIESTKLVKLENQTFEMSSMIAKFEETGFRKKRFAMPMNNVVPQPLAELKVFASTFDPLASNDFCNLNSSQVSLGNPCFENVVNSYRMYLELVCQINVKSCQVECWRCRFRTFYGGNQQDCF